MRKILITLPLLVLWACGGKPTSEGPQIISVDYDSAVEVPFDDEDIVMLETNDSSLLRTIEGLERIDGNYYVASVGKYAVFDSNGKYLYDIGNEGPGPGEYISPNSFWTEGDTICIHDSQLHNILCYDKQGKYIGDKPVVIVSDTIVPFPVHVFPASDRQGYYALNCYYGGYPEVEVASFYDRNMNFVNVIPGRIVGEGSYVQNRGRSDSGRMLYWEALRDTLFSITPDTIMPLYVLDLGKYALPQEIGTLQYQDERIKAVLDENADEMVTMFLSYQPYGDKLYFSMFNNKSQKVSTGVIDESTGKARVYHPISSSGHYKPQVYHKIFGDTLVMAVVDNEDMEANPGLLKIPLSRLK